MEARSQVDLPDGVGDSFDVFVNGVQQQPRRRLRPGRAARSSSSASSRKEGRLGFWRWLSLFLGVAGTYRRNDTVDVVYTAGAQRVVASLEPEPVDPGPGTHP